jgi:hypothetical protein
MAGEVVYSHIAGVRPGGLRQLRRQGQRGKAMRAPLGADILPQTASRVMFYGWL